MGLSHIIIRRSGGCPWLQCERVPGNSACGPLLDPAPAFLPLADFHVYPFIVINHSSEDNNFQVSSVSPSSELLKPRVVLETAELAIGVKSEGGLGNSLTY